MAAILNYWVINPDNTLSGSTLIPITSKLPCDLYEINYTQNKGSFCVEKMFPDFELCKFSYIKKIIFGVNNFISKDIEYDTCNLPYNYYTSISGPGKTSALLTIAAELIHAYPVFWLDARDTSVFSIYDNFFKTALRKIEPDIPIILLVDNVSLCPEQSYLDYFISGIEELNNSIIITSCDSDPESINCELTKEDVVLFLERCSFEKITIERILLELEGDITDINVLVNFVKNIKIDQLPEKEVVENLKLFIKNN